MLSTLTLLTNKNPGAKCVDIKEMQISSAHGEKGWSYHGCKVIVADNNRNPHVKHTPGNYFLCYNAPSFSY